MNYLTHQDTTSSLQRNSSMRMLTLFTLFTLIYYFCCCVSALSFAVNKIAFTDYKTSLRSLPFLRLLENLLSRGLLLVLLLLLLDKRKEAMTK